MFYITPDVYGIFTYTSLILKLKNVGGTNTNNSF